MASHSYDIIIVGGGSAGCVLATRLSEDPKRSVLLLEAGPDYPDPAALPPDIVDSRTITWTHDWGFKSEPGPGGYPITLLRGKLMGGSSAVNATIAARGAPDDYDAWAAGGNPGWSFEELLPYFQKLENDRDGDDRWHGRSGPLPIRRYAKDALTPTQAAFVEACTAIGHEYIEDLNAPGAVGVGPMPMTQVDGVRQSTATTYLASARLRPNLHVRAGILVDRVALENGRAVGVRLANPTETVNGRRVVVCGGSYGSPAILLRSGLGPADHLRELGIEVVEDRPGVGANLNEHPFAIASFAAVPQPAKEPVAEFQVMCIARSRHAMAGFDLHLSPRSILPVDPANPWMRPSPTGWDLSLSVGLVQAASRGQLRLRSTDPTSPPVIDVGLYSDPADLPRVVEGVQMVRQLATVSPLGDLIDEESHPRGDGSSAELEEIVRASTFVYNHPTSTCRMGPRSDAMAVVDSRGAVHGVDRLSVVDASIMPTAPSANTNVPTIMLAERCAEWLTE